MSVVYKRGVAGQEKTSRGLLGSGLRRRAPENCRLTLEYSWISAIFKFDAILSRKVKSKKKKKKEANNAAVYLQKTKSQLESFQSLSQRDPSGKT